MYVSTYLCMYTVGPKWLLFMYLEAPTAPSIEVIHTLRPKSYESYLVGGLKDVDNTYFGA